MLNLFFAFIFFLQTPRVHRARNRGFRLYNIADIPQRVNNFPYQAKNIQQQSIYNRYNQNLQKRETDLNNENIDLKKKDYVKCVIIR
mgnify:CR=1 FL=1